MNAPTFFFLYILPFVIAGAGWIAVLLNERSNRAKYASSPVNNQRDIKTKSPRGQWLRGLFL